MTSDLKIDSTEIKVNFNLKDPLLDLKEPVDDLRGEEDQGCPQCGKAFKKSKKYWYARNSNILANSVESRFVVTALKKRDRSQQTKRNAIQYATCAP